MAKRRLTSEDRAFFRLVSAATFANPFSEERFRLDKEISGRTTGKTLYEVNPDAIREVSRRIKAIDGKTTARIQDFAPSDREIATHVFLFDVYHKFNLQFDQFILAQAGSDGPLDVPFASEALELRSSEVSQQRKHAGIFRCSSRFAGHFILLRRA